jgi:hypothetical protein
MKPECPNPKPGPRIPDLGLGIWGLDIDSDF